MDKIVFCFFWLRQLELCSFETNYFNGCMNHNNFIYRTQVPIRCMQCLLVSCLMLQTAFGVRNIYTFEKLIFSSGRLLTSWCYYNFRTWCKGFQKYNFCCIQNCMSFDSQYSSFPGSLDTKEDVESTMRK